MLTKKNIKKCHFVPPSTMRNVMNILQNKIPTHDARCQRSLLRIQRNWNISRRDPRLRSWQHMIYIAMSRVVYSQDWDKLLFLLIKSPIWEHANSTFETESSYAIYIRALTILLMYHPYSKENNLLHDYLHMVLSCRSDSLKQAVMKVLLTLPNQLTRRFKLDEDE